MADMTYRGTITRVTAEGVWVMIPKLGLGAEYGPCQAIGGPASYATSIGAQILCTSVNGIPDDVVVQGRL